MIIGCISDVSGSGEEEAMSWKATGDPTVRRQREKWVVRVDGIDTETGRHRPRQLGTYKSQRAALAAARATLLDGRVPDQGTVGWLVKRYVASRTDLSVTAGAQVEWARSHNCNGPGPAHPDRPARAAH